MVPISADTGKCDPNAVSLLSLFLQSLYKLHIRSVKVRCGLIEYRITRIQKLYGERFYSQLLFNCHRITDYWALILPDFGCFRNGKNFSVLP